MKNDHLINSSKWIILLTELQDKETSPEFKEFLKTKLANAEEQHLEGYREVYNPSTQKWEDVI